MAVYAVTQESLAEFSDSLITAGILLLKDITVDAQLKELDPRPTTEGEILENYLAFYSKILK